LTQTSTKEHPDLEMTLNDIDFGIVVDSYIPGEKGSRWEPPVSPEFEWHFVDEDGYRADWIIDEMTADNMEDIEDYIFDNSREG